MTTKSKSYIFLSVLVIVILGSLLFFRGIGKSKKVSIILITVDTLRPEHLGCYGYPKNTSPNIDKFASESLLFTNCFSHAPETRYSFASMLSGYLPHETQIIKNNMLSEEVETLTEILKKKRYKTAAVISNFLLHKSHGWSQGFDVYDDKMEDYEQVRKLPERIAKNTTDRAIELLKGYGEDNLFMWIHYQDPYGPYTPPQYLTTMFEDSTQEPRILNFNRSVSGYGGIPSYQRLGVNQDYHHYVSQYDAEIRYVDEQIQRLFDTLKELGRYDKDVIIFSSDHGEGMGEHNYYFAHGENLYNGLLRVPLIIKYGNDHVGKREDYVQHLDIMPTIFNILGMKKNPHFRGSDLLVDNGRRREIFAEMNSPLVSDSVKYSIIVDGLKLIHTPLFSGYQLFDLTKDAEEKHNLIKDSNYTKQIKMLKIRLKQLVNEDHLEIKVSEKKPLSKEEIEKLKSLGYLR